MKKYKVKESAMDNVLSEGSKQEMIEDMAYLVWEGINYYCDEYSSDNKEDANCRVHCRMSDLEIVGDEQDDIIARISVMMDPGEVDGLGDNIEYDTPGVQMELKRIDDNPINQILQHHSGHFCFNLKGYKVEILYVNFDQFRR